MFWTNLRTLDFLMKVIKALPVATGFQSVCRYMFVDVLDVYSV